MNYLDANMLAGIGRTVREPFCLSAVTPDGAETDMIVGRILRLLPGKRIVGVAEVAGRQLLIKIFIGRFSNRYKKREVFGTGLMESADVLTPRLEWQAKLKTGPGWVLAFEYIEGARNLIDVWEQAKCDGERCALIRKVMPVLSTLHDAGVVQHDIHPENFLFRADRIYAVDGGGIGRNRQGPLGERKSVDNLAWFFAQFPSIHDHLVAGLFEEYRTLRGWPERPGLVAQLKRQILIKREARKGDYIQKAFRECTRFSCRSSLTRFTVCERRHDSAAMRALLANPDAAMAAGKRLKDGNTATVALVDGPSGKLVIKRYNVKNVRHRLARACRKSRAWVSWANTLRLEFLGISTVRPVALIEQRFGPLRGKAYFITEYVEGPDATMLAEQDDPGREILSIAAILQALSAAGVSHGDLKASNFLLGRDGPVIIDLDAMTEHRNPAVRSRAAKKDLERFMQNWESEPGVSERFAGLLG